MARRSLTLLVTAPLALSTQTGVARAVEFSNGCENSITDTERRILEAAFEFVEANTFTVFDEIAADRAGPNTHLYGSISSDTADDWRDQVAEMADGRMKIDCVHDSESNKCANSSGLAGWTLDLDGVDLFGSDVVHLCIDNIQSMGTSESQDIGIAAGTIAHELMHHVDGWDDHGGDGFTDPSDPDSPAETIGVAMEHLAASAELRPTVDSETLSFNADGTLTLSVNGTVANDNALSVGNTSTSGDARNGASRVCLTLDGAEVDAESTIELIGETDDAFSLAYTFQYNDLDAGSVFEVLADCDDALVEADEGDNDSVVSVDFRPDLNIVAEVAGPPVRAVTRSGAGLVVRNRVTWNLVVTNLDDTTAAATDIIVDYDDVTTGSRSQARIALPQLDGGEQFETTFSAYVPTLFGASVYSFDFQAGKDPLVDVDENPDDNVATVTLRSSTWKADYRPAQAAETTYINQTGYVHVSVENFGYLAGSTTSTLEVYDEDGDLVASRSIAALAVRGSETEDFELSFPRCDPQDFRFVVDADTDISENDENNNELVLRVGTTCTAIDPPGGFDPGPGFPGGGLDLPDDEGPAEVLGPTL
jgi:hypothetical protein